MAEQDNTPSVFRWAALGGIFVVSFVVLKAVLDVALTALFYGAVGLASAAIAVRVVKKLKQ